MLLTFPVATRPARSIDSSPFFSLYSVAINSRVPVEANDSATPPPSKGQASTEVLVRRAEGGSRAIQEILSKKLFFGDELTSCLLKSPNVTAFVVGDAVVGYSYPIQFTVDPLSPECFSFLYLQVNAWA